MPKPLIIFIILVGIGILGVTVLFPEYQKFADLRAQAKQKRDELQAKEQYISLLKNAAEEFKRYDVELAKVNSALPSTPDLPSLFDYLQRASSQNGLILKDLGSFSTVSSGANPRLKETKLDLAVSGSYTSLRNFFRTLEKSARLLDVAQLSLTKEEAAAGTQPTEELPFSLKLSIKTHSY